MQFRDTNLRPPYPFADIFGTPGDDHPAAAFTARHQAMRSSRVAFASRFSRSPWQGFGEQKALLVNDVINVAAQGVMSMIIIYFVRDRTVDLPAPCRWLSRSLLRRRSGRYR